MKMCVCHCNAVLHASIRRRDSTYIFSCFPVVDFKAVFVMLVSAASLSNGSLIVEFCR